MLSKFNHERAAFKPEEELNFILADLQETFLEEKKPSAEDGKLIAEGVLFQLHKMIYGKIWERISHPQFKLNSNMVAQTMALFGLNPKEHSLEDLQLVVDKSIKSYEDACAALTGEYPFESLFLELKCLIYDNQQYKNRVKKNGASVSFIETEITILRFLLKNVVSPHLNTYFSLIKDWYTEEPDPAGFKLHLKFKFNAFQEMDCFEFAHMQLSNMYAKCEQNEVALIKDEGFYHEINDDLDDIQHELEIYQLLFDLMMDALKNSEIVENVNTLLPLATRYFRHAACVKEIVTLLRDLSTRLDAFLATPAITRAEPISKDDLPEIAPALNKLRITEDNTQDTASLPPTKSSQPPIVISVPAKPEIKLPLETEVDPTASTSRAIPAQKMISHQSGQPAVPPSPHSLNEGSEQVTIKGNTAKKTILKIFDGDNKIKHDDLVTMIKSLQGSENKKTGSSSRKLHFADKKVFLHKRHGRDRAQYVDPKVIRCVKETLLALGITRDNLSFQQSPPSANESKTTKKRRGPQ